MSHMYTTLEDMVEDLTIYTEQAAPESDEYKCVIWELVNANGDVTLWVANKS